MRWSAVARGAGLVALVVLGALAAVVGAFLVPFEPLPGLSIGVVVAVAGNYALGMAGRRVGGNTGSAAAPGASWLAVVLYLGSGRAEGDLVLTNDAASFIFILAGAVAAAVGIARR